MSGLCVPQTGQRAGSPFDWNVNKGACSQQKKTIPRSSLPTMRWSAAPGILATRATIRQLSILVGIGSTSPHFFLESKERDDQFDFGDPAFPP
jgi:hypothetical protein